jgi:hypothetical protein
MSRAPSISDEEYASILKLLQEQNYDVSQVQKIPQQNNQNALKTF